MSTPNGNAEVIQLRHEVERLESRADEHRDTLAKLTHAVQTMDVHMQAQRSELRDTRDRLQAVREQHQRTVWKAAAVVSAAGPLLSELLQALQ